MGEAGMAVETSGAVSGFWEVVEEFILLFIFPERLTRGVGQRPSNPRNIFGNVNTLAVGGLGNGMANGKWQMANGKAGTTKNSKHTKAVGEERKAES